MRKPTVPEVMPVVWSYFALPGNSVGGSWHMVLDDGNCERQHVEWTIRYAVEHDDWEGVALGELLVRMSRTQVLKMSAQVYHKPPEASDGPFWPMWYSVWSSLG